MCSTRPRVAADDIGLAILNRCATERRGLPAFRPAHKSFKSTEDFEREIATRKASDYADSTDPVDPQTRSTASEEHGVNLT